MKADFSCIPCIMKQAYNTAIRATGDPVKIKQILDSTADYVKHLDFSLSPADSSNFVYRITREITGNPDPYQDDKKKYNDICLEMSESLRKRIRESNDQITTAAKVAVFGNLIDLGIGLHFDLNTDLEKVFTKPFAADDSEALKSILAEKKRNILYLGDNTGEIAFDKLFVEVLAEENEVTFVVKKGPIINDSTREDAEYVGMTKMVKVIDTGSDGIGVLWSEVSDEFRKAYEQADIIISKGQGNFETMNGKRGEIFFLLRAKCESVARELGVSFGDIVLKRQTVA